MESLFSIYIFEGHAIIALSNRKFENILYEHKISLSEFYEIMQSDKPYYAEYNGKLYSVYIPIMHGADDLGHKIIKIN